MIMHVEGIKLLRSCISISTVLAAVGSSCSSPKLKNTEYNIIDASIRFFMCSNYFKKHIENNSFIEDADTLGIMKHIVNDHSFKTCVYSETLSSYYSDLYKKLSLPKLYKKSSLLLRISNLLDREKRGDKIFEISIVNNAKKKPATAQTLNKTEASLSCIGCPIDAKHFKSCIKIILPDGHLKFSEDSVKMCENMQNWLSQGCGDEKGLFLSRVVIFDGGMLCNSQQIRLIYKDVFYYQQYDQDGKLKNEKYSLKSILYDEGKGFISIYHWKIKHFEEAENIFAELEQLFSDGSNKLVYLLYEREE
ncbi:hypothetical protein ENBRE01_0798 [Enteropsectra breve]|nr:hypothetical protein ENBRE01_0798 [Enteropsectra breve]